MEQSKAILFLSWGLRGLAAIILLQTLYFKFTAAYGALLSLGVISGAIFFHLTKLGIALTLVGDNGELFALAVIVFIASAATLYLEVLKYQRSHQSPNSTRTSSTAPSGMVTTNR